MSVLHLVNGVLIGPLQREIEVEHHLLLRPTLEEEVAGNVGADLLDQISQRHKLARPLAELHLLAAALHAHQLNDDRLEEVTAQT